MTAPTEADHNGIVFPVYVVVDCSLSMGGDPIKAANDIVPSLLDACVEHVALADMLRFSLITFHTTAVTVIPMGEYDKTTIPVLQTGGTATHYGAAFREVRSSIDKNIADLKAQGYKVFRPSVFFITDGEPLGETEAERKAAFADLTDPNRKSHPNILVFGVGKDVSENTLKQYISHKGKAYKTRDGATAADGVRSIIDALVLTLVTSVNNAAAGGSDGIVPSVPVDGDLDEIM